MPLEGAGVARHPAAGAAKQQMRLIDLLSNRVTS